MSIFMDNAISTNHSMHVTFQPSVIPTSSAALLSFDDPVGEAMNVLQEHASITNYQTQSSYGSSKEGVTPTGLDPTTESLVRLMDRAKQLHDSLLNTADDDDMYDEYDDEPNSGSRVNMKAQMQCMLAWLTPNFPLSA